jgi:hypothetical protein
VSFFCYFRCFLPCFFGGDRQPPALILVISSEEPKRNHKNKIPLKKFSLSLAAFLTLSTLPSAKADVIAGWNFQTAASTNAILAAGTSTAVTNVFADIGSGTGSGLHAGAAAWSSPAGNGSTNSWSSTLWAAGDFYQFAARTTGYTNIIVSFDQVSSGTGPGRFNFQDSTDGTAFTTFGSIYSVTSSPSWSVTTPGSAAESFSFDLSSVTALANASSVYLRLTDANTTSASGSTVGTAGTDRVDNFLIAGTSTSVPEPAAWSFAWLGLGSFVFLKNSWLKPRN